jgi:hypothetical protein
MTFPTLPTLNWKTSSAAVGFLLCQFAAAFYEPVAPACKMLDTLFIAFGLYAAADSSRVQNVVNAVDQVVIAAKVNLVQDKDGTVAPSPGPPEL